MFGRGGSGRRAEAEAGLRDDLARLDALDLDALADEVLVRVFGPGGQADDHGVVEMWRIVMPFDPWGTGQFPGMPKELRREFQELVEEGLQRLEHRGLVHVRVSGRDQTSIDVRLTRAGRRALGD
ncbi:MAG: hypothetical protein AB7V62_03510 [Thermoleophilia bacterium]